MNHPSPKSPSPHPCLPFSFETQKHALWCVAFVCLLLAVVLSGCGGGGDSSTPTQSTTGRVSIVMQWPTSSRLIHQNVNTLHVVVRANFTTLADKTLTKPDTTLVFDNLPLTSVTFDAELADTTNPSNTAGQPALVLGRATVVQQIQPTTTPTPITFTFATQTDHVSVTPASLSLLVGADRSLAAQSRTAPDATHPDGMVLLQSTADFVWSSDAATVATVDQSGHVHAVSAGTARISVTERGLGGGGKSAACAVTVLAEAPLITDLGTLPGQTESVATAINEAGQVVGGSGHPFLWTPEKGMQDLGEITGPNIMSSEPGYATAINSQGVVAGTSHERAFVWTAASGIRDIGSLKDGEEVSNSVSGIDDSGQIVGNTGIAAGDGYSSSAHFRWTAEGGKQGLGLSGFYDPFVTAISRSGLIVGIDQNTGVRYSFAYAPNGRTIQIGDVAQQNYAYGVSPEGRVCGQLFSSGGAFVWSESEGFRDIGKLPNSTAAIATAINDEGQVVGVVETSSGFLPFLWTAKSGMVNLNTLLPPNSGWVLKSASGINSKGQIVGNGTINGQTHAFLLRTR